MPEPTAETQPLGGDAWVGDRPPDPGLFFGGAAQLRLLELLRHLTENTADVALVVGPHGAGKTTLLFQFQGQAPSHWTLCRVDANPMLHPDQLLNHLARRIGAPRSDDPSPEALAAAFASVRLQGRLPVVVVDDAEQLPISSLMLLLHLHERQTESLPVCALVMLADPAIDAVLSSHQLHAMGTARFQRLELPPLLAEQMPDYVRHFLRVEGIRADLRLSPERLARIHRDSDGIPGRVNELVIRSLREPGARPGPGPLTPLWRWLRRLSPVQAALVTGVALVILLVLVFQGRINALIQGPKTPAPPPGEVSRPLPLPPSQPTAANTPPGKPEPPPAPEPAAATEARPAPESMADARPTPAAQTPAAAAAAPGPQAQAKIEPLIPPAPAPEPKPAAAPASAAAPEPKPAASAASAPAPEPKPTASATPAPAPARAPERNTREEKRPALVQRPAPAAPAAARPAAPKPPPAPHATTAAATFHDEVWLLQRPPGQWTVQILAAGSEAALHDFVRHHHPRGELAFFRTRRNGRPWFPLLLGVYPDHAAASAARDALPKALRATGAWPRSFASVQQEILKRTH